MATNHKPQDDMQKLVTKYLLTSLVSITLAIKLQHNSDDLPVH